VASRRKEHQEDAKFRMFQMINENPQMTMREIAQIVEKYPRPQNRCPQ
tara:strand:+ start:671 stop:814 length:144 start_codon:yes stop_codon:yes gene_type:complete